MRKDLALPALAVLVAVAALACHTITEELPGEHTPVTPATVPVIPPPVIVIPVPTVTPPPAAPNPPGTPPAPNEPPSEPAPGGASCSLPPGQWNENCHMQAQTFLSRVEAAIDEVVRTEPHLFNMNRTRCSNCYEVRDPTRYVNRVAELITRNGVCGYYDGEELAVKSSNQFNDQYDILTSDNFIRRGDGAYRSTCRPAWF